MGLLGGLNSKDHDVLALAKLFSGLKAADLQKVSDQLKLKTIEAGKDFLIEGQLSRGLWIILEGEAQVYLPRIMPDKQKRASEINLAKRGPGTVLGEFSLIDNHPSSASVRAMTACRCAFFSQMDFELLCDDQPALGLHITRNLLKSTIQVIRKMDNELDIIYKH